MVMDLFADVKTSSCPVYETVKLVTPSKNGCLNFIFSDKQTICHSLVIQPQMQKSCPFCKTKT